MTKLESDAECAMKKIRELSRSKALYARSMDLIDSIWVVYRIDNPSARLVTDTEKDAVEGQRILTAKFKTHKVKFSHCTLHDYFNILRKAKKHE